MSKTDLSKCNFFHTFIFNMPVLKRSKHTVYNWLFITLCYMMQLGNVICSTSQFNFV
jgi:hypothetical protein